MLARLAWRGAARRKPAGGGRADRSRTQARMGRTRRIRRVEWACRRSRVNPGRESGIRVVERAAVARRWMQQGGGVHRATPNPRPRWPRPRSEVRVNGRSPISREVRIKGAGVDAQPARSQASRMKTRSARPRPASAIMQWSVSESAGARTAAYTATRARRRAVRRSAHRRSRGLMFEARAERQGEGSLSVPQRLPDYRRPGTAFNGVKGARRTLRQTRRRRRGPEQAAIPT